jgi:hypothetical protein
MIEKFNLKLSDRTCGTYLRDVYQIISWQDAKEFLPVSGPQITQITQILHIFAQSNFV